MISSKIGYKIAAVGENLLDSHLQPFFFYRMVSLSSPDLVVYVIDSVEIYDKAIAGRTDGLVHASRISHLSID